MTDCVQRHDVAPSQPIVIERERWDDFRLIAKIVAAIVAVHAAAYLIVVLA
jgi:hypothetical protein